MRGIDYGMGQTNIDRETGIRYGVIHHGEICQAWSDSSEADYGDPTCPKCGGKAVDTTDPEGDVHPGDDGARDDYTVLHHACGDWACDDCRMLFDGEDAYGEEPNGYYLDDGEYVATQSGDDCDVFVLKSPYYTRAAFCSPCAPGACYLLSPCEDGAKAYCFGHDWFDDGIAPYPVYRVSDDTLVSHTAVVKGGA
jgi:ribosomal protein L37AE/L43A